MGWRVAAAVANGVQRVSYVPYATTAMCRGRIVPTGRWRGGACLRRLSAYINRCSASAESLKPEPVYISSQSI